MSVQIVTKNSATAGSEPAANALVQGELAVNVKDQKLFSKDADGNVFEFGPQMAANTLQQVTDAGNTTTNDIETGNVDLSQTGVNGCSLRAGGRLIIQRALGGQSDTIASYSGTDKTFRVTAAGTSTSLGGVRIGADDSAHQIDVYEVGTWTPVIIKDNGDVVTSITASSTKYVKIGNTVTCYVNLEIDSDVYTETTFRMSLPFASSPNGSMCLCPIGNLSGNPLIGFISGSNMRAGVPTDITGKKQYRGSFTYYDK